MAEDSDGEPVDADEKPDSESPPSSSVLNPDLMNGSELALGNVMQELNTFNEQPYNTIQRKDLTTVTRSLETVVKQLYRVFKFLKCLSELTI